MKKYASVPAWMLLIASFPFFSASAQEKWTMPENLREPSAAMVRVLVGVLAEKQCDTLAPEFKKRFDQSVALNTNNLNVALVSVGLDKGRATHYLTLMLQEADNYAQHNFKNCNEEARSAILGATLDSNCINSYLNGRSDKSCFTTQRKKAKK